MSSYNRSEIKNCEIHADVTLVKSSSFMQFEFDLSGQIEVACDRCLETFNQDVEYFAKLTVKFGEENSSLDEADDSITLSLLEDNIILDKHFFDYVHLSLPIKNVHPDDSNGQSQCNPEMLQRIMAEQEEEVSDPRWDALKSLMN